MNKSDLVAEAVRRSGLTRRAASRGVEAALEIIKRELGSRNSVSIRGLGRLQLRQKRSGFLPAADYGAAPIPIPAGKAVRLKATRKAVASLNTEPLKLDKIETKFGGTMDKKHEK